MPTDKTPIVRNTVNVLGCLPLVIGLLLLGGMGFCGGGCQSCVLDGIKDVSRAAQGYSVVKGDAQ